MVGDVIEEIRRLDPGGLGHDCAEVSERPSRASAVEGGVGGRCGDEMWRGVQV